MDQQDILIKQNKSVRGYIMRALAGATANSMQVNVILAMLIDDKQISEPDISKHLDYLIGKGYIEFLNNSITAFNAVQNYGVAHLTAKGIDLIEGTINDPGVLL